MLIRNLSGSKLQDNNLDVRKSTVEALGKIDPNWTKSEFATAAVPALVAVLQDSAQEVAQRSRAAWALGTIMDMKAVVPLILTLKDSDVGMAATEALEKIAPNWTKSEVAKAAVPILITVIQDRDRRNYKKRYSAAFALGEIKDARAFEVLITALNDHFGFISSEVAKALEKIDPNWANSDAANTAVPVLITLLQESREEQQSAVHALGEIKDARAVEPLILKLKDSKDDILGMKVAEALGKIGDTRAVEPLILVLKDASIARSSIIIEALGKIGDARAIKPLTAVMNNNPVRDVREKAEAVLKQIKSNKAKSKKQINPISTGKGTIRKETVVIPNIWGSGDGKPFVLPRNPDVSSVFAALSIPELNVLKGAYLRHPDPNVRLATITEITKLEMYHLQSQELVDLLADTSSAVRNAAAQAMWLDNEAVENALRCLRDEIHGTGYKSTMSSQDALRAVEILQQAAPSTNDLAQFNKWVSEK